MSHSTNDCYSQNAKKFESFKAPACLWVIRVVFVLISEFFQANMRGNVVTLHIVACKLQIWLKQTPTFSEIFC